MISIKGLDTVIINIIFGNKACDLIIFYYLFPIPYFFEKACNKQSVIPLSVSANNKHLITLVFFVSSIRSLYSYVSRENLGINFRGMLQGGATWR